MNMQAAASRAPRPAQLMRRLLAAFREEAAQAQLPEDLQRWVHGHFAEGEREAALACLRGAVTYSGEPAGARLLRCAAVASGGDLGRLQQQVEQLGYDFRDVVMAGEYTVRDKRLVRARDLGKPLADA